MICKRLNCRFWSCIAKATSPQWDERIVVPHCWNLNIWSRSNLIWVDDSNKWSEWKRKAGTGEGFRYSRTNRRRNEFDRISGGNQNYFHCDCFQQNWHNPCHHFYHPHLHPSHHLYPHQRILMLFVTRQHLPPLPRLVQTWENGQKSAGRFSPHHSYSLFRCARICQPSPKVRSF